ncbi:MAG: hypothetical protein OXG83_05480 [Acidobacteria bacterium]|nr:hypothetical protein [Acidobacteriota bacterium]
MTPGADPGSGDRDYFEVIEEEFIRLRGAPLLLSPADWRLARQWRRDGVPLTLVLESIREVFARRAERAAASPDAPKRRVSSLRYCRPAVEKAWAVHRELGPIPSVQRPPPAIDVPRKLVALAAALPSSLQGVDATRRRLLALDGPAPEIEARLAELDLELVARAFDSLAAPDREAVVAGADEALRRTAGRVEEQRLPDLRQRLVRRLVRERLGLPLLSLFAETATSPGEN